jgi:hypothetical protein
MGSGRVVVTLDPGVDVAAEAFAKAWNADPEVEAVGRAEVEPAGPGSFLPGVVELVVLPLAVNLASTVVYEQVRNLVNRLRGTTHPRVEEEVEVIEHVSGADRILVVRVRRSSS